jgi:hypothetical protein
MSLKRNLATDENVCNKLLPPEPSFRHEKKLKFSPHLRSCTYVATDGEFTEQHWYNCYTCGLIWDKGCCSLCARVCHKGHDVGYSRKSSFFCDCGAEVETNIGKVSCKCLSPLSSSFLSSVYESNNTLPAPCEEFDNYYLQQQSLQPLKSDVGKEMIHLVCTHFSTLAQKALDDYVSSVNSTLIGDLFDVFKSHFEHWVDQRSLDTFLSRNLNDSDPNSMLSFTDSGIASRDGLPLNLSKASQVSFSPIRMSRTSVINTSLSSDTNTIKLKKSSNHTSERCFLVADSRGRIIVP